MRILWHGISPYRRTGYGVQTRLFAPLIRDLGHTVAVAQMGAPHPQDTRGRFDGIPVIGPGPGEYGLPPRAQIRAALGGEPDLVIVLKDMWVLPAEQYIRYNTAGWCNIDCDPMGEPDRAFFEISGAHPVAVSQHGRASMRQAGLKDASYVPHGIDTEFWRPGDQREARELLGLPPGAFIAGLNAMNLGQVSRKALYEQLAAFASFHGKLQPGSLLLAHTEPEHPEGLNLRRIVDRLGIADAVNFGAHRNMSEFQMLTWYRSLDVLLNATCGEGFGVPIIEAEACGIPVIGTECTSMPELIPSGSGWLVHGQPFWNEHHVATWTVPAIGQITAKLAQAVANRGHTGRAAIARAHVLKYDAAQITREHWKPLLEELTA